MATKCPVKPEVPASALLVGPLASDRSSLRNILENAGWLMHEVSNRLEALAFVRKHRVPVVVSERDLPDGDWKLLLDDVTALPCPPALIVSSRTADERLWAEVLNLGGYDLLVTPFEAAEVRRVVSLAASAWRQEHEADASPAERWPEAGAAAHTA